MDEEASVSADLEDTLRTHRRVGEGSEGTLVVSDQEGYVGDTITVRGHDLPANEEYDVRWHSTEGRWGVIGANEVVGPQYEPRTETILTVRTGESGGFDAEWTVPRDYGGSHRIEVVDDEGEPVDRAEFEIVPWFEIDRTEIEMGEAFTVTGYGLGPSAITNNYQITWDNGFVGFVTGVMNRGTATAQVRAVGPPGTHVIQVWRNYRGVPYLQNNTQSPFGPVGQGRQSRWAVEVIEPTEAPRTAWVDPQLDEAPIPAHYPEIDEDTDAELDVSPTSGQPGTTVLVTGRNFPPNTEVDLIWYRHEGHRPKGIPITPEPKPEKLPTVSTDDDGSFQERVEMPVGEGSTRPIAAAVDGREVAVTGFVLQPSIERFEPTSGPVNTTIEIELSGIGWTTYENAPFLVYDNKPLGYTCGLSNDDEKEVLRVEIPATGESGWHFIDAYPTLFEMREDELEFEIRPHLSYIDNHPVRPLPALHFAFEITEE
ncbi:MAG: hypothetical protein V5A28_01150 [Haloarculaceae archaeon]